MTTNKVTIVTVIFNDKKNIKETIDSCLNQTFVNKELIIIDGGSTDGSLEIINTYKDKCIIISEPDKGIYDAMNKGIELSNGEWIIFMNSGDTFFNITVLENIFSTEHNCDLIYGKNQSIYPYFKRINFPQPISKIKYGMIFSHQSMFVKTNLMKNNKFDLSYKISADYNFIYSLYKNKRVFKEVDIVVSCVLSGGTSEINLIKTHLERKKIALSYEKGINKFLLNINYNFVSLKILFIKLVKKVLPYSLIKKITILKYK